VVVVSWLGFHQIPYWLGRGVPAVPPALVPHPEIAPAGREGVLGGGLEATGRLELLALREANSPSAAWWRPDGQPVAQDQFEIRNGPVAQLPTGRNLDLAFRLASGSGAPLPSLFEFEPDTGALFGGTLAQGGADVPGGWPIRLAFSPATRTATFRFGYGLEPWRPIRIRLADGRLQETGRMPGDPDWKAAIRTVGDADGSLWVSADLAPEAYTFRGLGTDAFLAVMAGGEAGRAWRIRLVVEDRDGRTHLPTNARTGAPGAEWTPWDFEFSEVRADRVGHIRLEVQPVRWVEFRDVALYPVGTDLPPADRAEKGPASP
jgi:hypothetical protein